MLTKNQIITAKIESMSYGGFGIAKYEGIVLFVSDSVVGDFAEIKILKVQKSYAFAKIEKLITPSVSRILHFCEKNQKCGCCFSGFNYEEELNYKKGFVKDAFLKIAKMDLEIPDVIPSPVMLEYRNKVQFPVGMENSELKIGFYYKRSHRIADIDECGLHNPVFKPIIPIFKNWILKNKISVYDELNGKGLIRHICGRTGINSFETALIIVANGKSIPHFDELKDELIKQIPTLKSIILNINNQNTNVIMGDECITLWGKDKIYDYLDGLKFNLSPLSFYQINPHNVVNLYSKALELANVTGNETVIDLYCGVGTVSLFFARKCKRVIGVEIIPEAIEDAIENAKQNNLLNCEFILGDASIAAEKLRQDNIKPDIIVVDPIRKGLEPELIETINEMSPEKIIYISCDPTTLARDVKMLCDKGYVLKNLQPVDMFPKTYHVECVVLMSRIKE